MEMSDSMMEYYSTSGPPSLEEEFEKVKKEKDYLTDGLNFMWKQKEQLERQLENIRKSQDELKSENRELKENMKEQTALAYEQEGTIFRLKTQFDMAKEWTDDGYKFLNNQNTDLILKVKQMERLNETNNKNIKSLRTENVTLKTENVTLKTENVTLKTENDSLKTENDSLKTENDSLKTENDSLKTENDSLKTDNDSLKTDNDSLKTDNDSLKTDNDSLKTDNDSQKTDNDSQKTDNDSQKTDNDSLKTDNDSLKTENHILKSKNDNANKRGGVKDCTDKFKSENGSSEPSIRITTQAHEEIDRLKRQLLYEQNELRETLEKQKRLIEEKDAEIALQRNELVQVNNVMRSLQHVFEMTQGEKLDLKENVKLLKVKIRQLEGNLMDLRNEKEAMEKSAKENEVAQRKAQREHDSEFQNLFRQHDEFRNQTDKIIEESVKFRRENEQLINTLDHTKQRIEHLETMLKAERLPSGFDMKKFETDLLTAAEQNEDQDFLNFYNQKIRLESVESEIDSLMKRFETEKAKRLKLESRNKALSNLLDQSDCNSEKDTVKSMISRKSTEFENVLLKEELRTLQNDVRGRHLIYRDSMMDKEVALAVTVLKISRLTEELKRDKTRLDRLIDEKKKTKETFDKEKKALEKQLTDEKGKTNQQEAITKSLQTDIKALNVKYHKLEDYKETLLKDKMYFDSELTSLKFENKDLLRAIGGLEEENAKQAKDAERYKRDLARTKETLQREIANTKETLQRENENKQRENENKRRENENKQREMQNLEREKTDEIEEKLKAEQQKWKQRTGDQKRAWDQEKLLLIDSKRDLENKLRITLNDIDKLKRDLLSVEAEKTEVEEKCDALRIEMEETAQYLELKRTRETVEGLRKDLRDRELEIFQVKEAFASQKEKREKEILEFNDRIEKGDKELSTFKSKGKKLVDKLRADNGKLEEKISDLVKDKEILENRIQFELETFKQQIAEKDEQLQTEQAMNESLKEKLLQQFNDTSSRVPNSTPVEFRVTSNKDDIIAKLTSNVSDLKEELVTWTMVVKDKEEEAKELNEESSNKESVIKAITADVEGLQLRNSLLYSELDKYKDYLNEWTNTLSSSGEDGRPFGNYYRDTKGEKINKLMKKKLEYLKKTLVSLGKFDKYATSDCFSVIREFMEAELSCAVCSDLITRSVTLNCSHTFCESCLNKWKESKRDCPMCRTPIRHEARTNVIDNVVEKLLECFPKQHVIDASVNACHVLNSDVFPTLSEAAFNL